MFVCASIKYGMCFGLHAFLDYPCQPPSSIALNNGEYNVHVFQQCKQIMFLLHLPD